MQRILGLFGRHTSSAEEEQKEIERLQELVDAIFEQVFGLLVTQYALSKQQAESDAKREPHSLFEKSIVAGLKSGHPTAAQALRARFHAQRRHSDKNCLLLTNQLKTMFSHDMRNAMRLQATVDKEIPTAIAYALQETAFGIPKIMYSGTEQVSDKVEDGLTNILENVDTIRQHYELQAPVLGLSSAAIRLYQEIAQVDGYVILPLKRLPTASLTKDDLKDFYVSRRLVDVDNLARSILRNDGVILVAGYRGVGKSTFVNAALSKLPDIEKLQQGNVQWRVVPVQISVAKIAGDAGALNVLRLCIRALYRTFLGTDSTRPDADLEKPLDKSDVHLLKWANLRASYKVDMTQGESISSLRDLEVSLDLKPGDLLPKPITSGILGLLLPGLSGKYSKEWKKQVEQTIALLDYDAERAEEDIVRIIDQLSRPGTRRKVGIKLVFIFDEMDKLEIEEVKTLIKQLKNLFLTRNAVFLLVTGKEVYYERLKGQKDEDSPFGSYFSNVVTVPLFTSRETTELLEKLWLKDRASLSSLEKTFIQMLGGYLTYQGRGLPREIIRELQDIQHWVEDSLQSYVTDGSDQTDKFQTYAELQKVIEGVVNDVPNKQWQEQIERGLYVLIEEFFDQKIVVLDTELKSLEEIRKRNFELVPIGDFKFLVESLKLRLPTVPITNISHLDDKQTLFSLTSQGDDLILTVDDLFYKLTGRSTSASPLELEDEKENLSIETINSYLRPQQSRFRWKQAFSALRQTPREEYTADTIAQLYRIFTDVSISSEYAEFRPLAARYLSESAFFEHAMAQVPKQFIAEETNEQLLRSFIQLIQQGNIQHSANEQERRHAGTQMLLDLLTRHKQVSASKSSVQQLPKGILTDLLSTLSLITEEDILDQVVANLDPQQDVSDVLQALQRLQQKSHQPLIDVLLAHDFQAIEPITLQNILNSELSQDRNRLHAIWSLAMKQKQKKLARQIISAIVQQWSTSNIGQDAILQWVDGADWDVKIDKPILREAVVQNRTYFSELAGRVSSYASTESGSTTSGSAYSQAQARLTEVLKETEPPPPLAPSKPEPQGLPETFRSKQAASAGPLSAPSRSSEQTTQFAPRSSLRGWSVVLAMLAILAVYFAVPFDLPGHVTLVGRLMARFLETVYVCGGVFGIFLLIVALVPRNNRKTPIIINITTRIILLIVAVGCFLLQFFFFPLAFTFWGQVILIGLLVLFWLPLLALINWRSL